MTEAGVRKLLAREIDKAGGLRPFCREHDLDPSFTKRVRDNETKISPAILNALGLEVESATTTYRHKGKRKCL